MSVTQRVQCLHMHQKPGTGEYGMLSVINFHSPNKGGGRGNGMGEWGGGGGDEGA